MIIDNNMRRRWGFIPHHTASSESDSYTTETDLAINETTGQERGVRFRVSAEEWLPTWRMIES